MSNRPARARGVGARLLLAFVGISAFSALVAGAAIYAFYQVGQSLALIDRRIDPILASLEVSHSVERIVKASLALSAATTEQEREHDEDRELFHKIKCGLQGGRRLAPAIG